MTAPASSPWHDPALTERLRELWNEGKTHSQIAAILGHDLTRSAIAGRINRLGITRAWILSYANQTRGARAAKAIQDAANVGRAIAAKKTMSGNGVRRALKFGEPVSATPKPPRKPKPDPVYNGEPVSVVDVRLPHCRWPVMAGDEFRGFCGAPKERGSYCERHAKVAYVPGKKVAA